MEQRKQGKTETNYNHLKNRCKRCPRLLSEKYRMMKEQVEKEIDTDCLRQQLTGIEGEIIFLAKPFHGNINRGNAQKREISSLLTKRQIILNRMFELHCNETEVRRFEVVNTALKNIMNGFYEEHNQLREQLDMLPCMAEPNVGKLALFSVLYYLYDHENPQIFEMEEDVFYGSHWDKMIWTISCMCDTGIHSWQDYDKNDFYNGLSWADGPLDIPPLKHICVCYLAHILCLHFPYSVPDLLRMTTYSCERFMVDWSEAKIEGN